MCTIWESFGTICVAFVVFQLLRTVLRTLYNHVLAPRINDTPNLKEQGKWALVTGATDGLGKAFAEALAAKKINVILISRTMEKLKNVAEEIEKKYQVETKVIAADFSKVEDTYKHIAKNIDGYEIGILINNVGLSYPYPQYFLSSENDKIYPDIINCNVYSVTNMCQLIMPGMVERKRGIVINLSSTAAKIPSPMLTVYSASKAYIDKFSADLSAEYSKHGIIVQSLLPGYVATKMSKIRKPTLMAPSPDNYVKYAFQTLGLEESTTGYYPHTLMMAAIHLVEFFSENMARKWIIGVMEKVRDRALRRKEN